MDKLNLMNSFVQVAEQGSFTLAAKKLGKTKALMSTHVSQLEDDLDVRLINRSTRGMQLTSTGRAYLEQAKKLLDDLSNLEAQLQQSHHSLAGRLRISAPATLGEKVLTPFITQFCEQHPQLTVDLVLNDRYVDIISEGYDVAIRIGDLKDSNLVARPVGEVALLLVASPEFVRRFGLPKSPEELNGREAVEDSNVQAEKRWRLGPATHRLNSAENSDNKQHHFIKPVARITVNSALAAGHIAADSCMIALCPRFAIAHLIKSQRLVQLLPDYHLDSSPIHVVYPYRQHLSAKVNLFSDALKQYLIDSHVV
ncbi:MAG: LysR family transcriptional regulator [Pontibacterium sp.]